MSSDLAKKEEEFKELEAEFEANRERYGCLTDDEASGDEFLEEQGNARADDDCQETKPDSDFEDCSSNHEEDAENIDQSGDLVQMESSEESTAVNGASAEEGKENVSKEGMVKELSEITERLSALQSDGELLKHIQML
ncbi:hypothetical protein Bca101_010798 [Brassica carinata]